MSGHDELSKRVDNVEEDSRELRTELRALVSKMEKWGTEITVLTTSMAALQRRQVEKQATWSRVIEVISAASFVFSAIAAGVVVLH